MQRHHSQKFIHEHEMAEASAHHEEMEDFMGTEVFVASIEDRQFQCIDNAADGIDDASGKQPEEGFSGEAVENLGECQNTGPSHTDIENGGNPFRTVDPEGLEKNPENGDAPDDG